MENCANGKIRLRGAKFVLYNACGQSVACGVTNDNGEICFDNLPLGKYYLMEVVAPCGFEISDVYCVVVICENKRRECVEFVNVKLTGSIKVVKYGKNCI